MKHIGIKNCMVMGGAIIAVFLSGCISIPNSPTPRFYMLGSVQQKKESKEINNATSVIIGVGPVTIPEYQNRPQIVTQSKEKMLAFAQFDRWGESLDVGIARLIEENLASELAEAKLTLYPWNTTIPVKYQVIVEVVQLDSQLDKDLFLAAHWYIIDTKNTRTILIKESEFRQPITPHNYTGLANTLSAACASISSEIARALVTLETHPQPIEEGAILKEKAM